MLNILTKKQKINIIIQYVQFYLHFNFSHKFKSYNETRKDKFNYLILSIWFENLIIMLDLGLGIGIKNIIKKV